jgi:hypothetical protein
LARTPTVAVGEHPDGLDSARDASTGLPAISADRAHIAFLFAERDLGGFSDISFEVVSTKTGALERQIQIVHGEEVLWEIEERVTGLMAKVDARVAVANQILLQGGYAPMLVVGKTLEVDELRAHLDRGRFRVTGRDGAVRLDVDAASWTPEAIQLGESRCTFRTVPTMLAVDEAKQTLAVVVEQIGEGGGDACGAPREIKVFPLI